MSGGQFVVTSIAIIDPREIWSAGVASVAREAGLHLAGVWPDAATAAPELHERAIDILIVAAALAPKLSASGVLRREPRPSIILVTEPGESLTDDGIAGLHFEGLLMRNSPLRVAKACVTSIAAGHAWLDPAVLSAIRENDASNVGWACLSSREIEIAKLAVHGLSNKGIARALEVSDGTVKMHMHHILSKLRLSRRADLSNGSGLVSGRFLLAESAKAERARRDRRPMVTATSEHVGD